MKRKNITSPFAAATCLACFLVADSLRGAVREQWVRPIQRAESHLREIIRRAGGPEEIYALLSEGGWGGVGQKYVFVSNNHAVLHCDDDNGRARERDLTTVELDELRTWVSTNKIDRLAKFDEGSADGIQYEYFHAVRNGDEHRVFMNNPPGAPIGAAAVFFGSTPLPNRQLYGELTRLMLKLADAPTRVTYQSLEKLPGFRVVHAKEKGEVTAISVRDGHLFAGVLTSDDKPVEWHRVTESGLMNEFVAEKTEIDPTVNQYETDKGYDVYEGPLTGRRLQAEFASMGNRKDGLWALRKHEKAELIAEGVFGRPVLCLSGEWIVVAKTPTGKMWNVPNGVVRIHLPDKRMFDVDLPPADNFDPVAWIEARKRVLLYRQRDPDGKVGPKTPEFHIVDPLTGAHEKVEGEFRPFFDARRHPLQSTGSPNEFWGTLHSSIVDPKLHTTTLGRFDSSSFRFTPLVSFPDVEFDSAGVCVDEKSQQIWVNVNGDLLSVSLPR